MKLQPGNWNIPLWLAAFGMAMIGVMMMLLVSRAHAHSFYDPWCCSDRDCRPIEAKFVHETLAGWDIAKEAGGGFFPRGNERQSPDGEFHICRFPASEIRCFYVPPRGS